MNIHPRLVSGLCWFNGITAVYGGGYLLGGAKGMDVALLDGTPFRSYVIPGIILLVVVGGSSMLAATARLGGHNARTTLTILAGLILVVWLAVEFVLLPEWWPAQVFYGIVGALILAGGIRERANPDLPG